MEDTASADTRVCAFEVIVQPIPATASRGEAPCRNHAQNTKHPAISKMAAVVNANRFAITTPASGQGIPWFPVDR